MASKLKLTELLYPTSTTAAITINSDDSVTIPTQSTTNLAYTGTLTGGTGVVNLGSGQFYKDASGNVGIGTSSPATYGKLAIGLSASAGTNNVFGVYQSSGVDGAALRFAGYNYANNVQTAIDFVQNSASNFQSQITFNTNNGSGLGEKMRIDSSGNVGIGGVSPAGIANRNFMVSGVGVNTASMTLGDYSANAGSLIPFVESFGNRLDANGSFGGRFGASYRRCDGAAIPATATIGYYAFGGQWGTDTSYQSAKHLYSASIAGVAEGSFTSATAMPTAITFRTGSTGESLDGANTAYGTERMRIDSSGNLLVGTNSQASSAKLSISGNVGATGGYYSHQGTAAGNAFGSPWNFFWTGAALEAWVDGTNVGNVTLVSDYRLKKNIETQNIPALERVLQIRPVTYEFKDYGEVFKADGIIREGFIAHELAEVIPSAVEGEKDAENQIQSLRLDALCSVLTKAIQEQQALITQLQTDVATLKGAA